MKKNLILIASMAVAVFTASCDSKTTESEATADATVISSDQTQPVVENPNVVQTSGDASATTPANPNAPVITFAETEYDFGSVTQGKVIDHTFKFTNTGKSPLIIESASATCGCTVPQKPEGPIAPGETGEIKVQFNTTGKVGQQAPIITVRANTEPNIMQVQMKGTVEPSGVPANANGPLRTN
ncbi:DUF1573 domain-containing protein [Pontibacter arcticus]|uniref:DUF1573 domain-containing protein n=1 Tax=Pontibacter arcticus TaxID=2080288 RepID=A0A364RIS3_9BACT|nr:DUF1573 domain-containing protein [Pontibacter arcticus]RAU84173.1 DUF1573 domain-containing protein [Pontibacter arcticus]